jgi:hypothetical protein
MTTARASHVATMRARILAFLATQTEPVPLGDIKRHLGLDEWKVNGWLDQALRSKRIQVDRYHPQIASGKGLTLYAATPVRLFSLAKEGAL